MCERDTGTEQQIEDVHETNELEEEKMMKRC